MYYIVFSFPKIKTVHFLFIQKYEFKRLLNEDIQEAFLIYSGKISVLLLMEGNVVLM